MQADPPQGDPRNDAELISAARLGEPSAFGILYARHAPAVTAMARYYARDDFTADDLVSEAFERTMGVLRGGGGPDVSFRAYIYTVVRRLAYEQTEKSAKTHVTDDFTAFEMPDEIVDPAVSSFEGRVVTGAFATLPERWQAVLWYIEVEGMSPPEVAPILGLTANGVSALAYRAREGLRQAYLQLHVTSSPAKPNCEPFRGKLGSFSRDDVSARDKAKIEDHLSTCDECTAIVAELQDVGHGMRVIIAPLVLGGAAAAGLGFMSPPSSASAAAVVLAPRGMGKVGKTVTAAASIAAVAILGTIAAVALWGGVAPTVEAIGDTSQVEVSSPSTTSTPRLEPTVTSTTPPAPPTVEQRDDNRDDDEQPGGDTPVPPTSTPTASPTVAPTTTPRPTATPTPTPTSTPTATPTPTPTSTPPPVTPTIAVAMDEVGNLVLGRDGMVGATVRNTGSVVASSAVLRFDLPMGVSLDESRTPTTAGAEWNCDQAAEGIICTVSELPAGQSTSVFVPVFVAVGTNTTTVPSVTVSADRVDPVTAHALSPAVGSGLGTRFLADGSYGITESGASFLTCDSATLGCTGAQQRVGAMNNDMYPMVPVDEAGLGTTSSISTLDLPAGATVTSASLYWSALSSTSASTCEELVLDVGAEASIQLTSPSGSSSPVSAERVDHSDLSQGCAYQSFADVTALVQAGGAGAWTASGAHVSAVSGAYAGWSLVVVYNDPTLSPGRVAVFDGMQKVGDASVTFDVAGVANTAAEVGMVVWEGDGGISGDGVELDSAILTRAHPGANPNNSFDSTAHGSSVLNSFGVDVGSFLPTMLTRQQVPLTALTAGDHYVVGVVTVTSR
ncbi:MAG: sigma-70 family RNA polymerase sigma factor [Rhodoglobus sp.]